MARTKHRWAERPQSEDGATEATNLDPHASGPKDAGHRPMADVAGGTWLLILAAAHKLSMRGALSIIPMREVIAGVRVNFHVGARQFLAAAENFLRSDPFSTNVMAVVAGRIVAGIEPHNEHHLWAIIADDEGHVVGAAMHTPPHHLFVSRMPAAAARSLAQAVADTGRDLPGVNGAIDAAAPFAEAWVTRTGRTSTVVTAMRMYRLGQLTWPQSVAGEAIVAASPRDVEVVASWLEAFHAEAEPHAPTGDWRLQAERRVGSGEIHLWGDAGTLVSLAGVSAPAAGVARVGPVYTPPTYRRRGYGAAVTAQATSAAFSTGAEYVVLYTDLANPTSNSIYQGIGYLPDHDAEERAFR